MYAEAIQRAKSTLGDGFPETLAYDNNWVTNTNRNATDKLTKLESALSLQKRQEEREATRVVSQEIADHYLARGDLQTALAKYMETKDYVSTNQHTIENALDIIKASIHMGSLSHIKTQVDRAKRVAGELKKHPQLAAQFNAALGLYNLKDGNYYGAADNFVNVTSDMGNTFNDVINLKDVATYACFCALVSYNRRELQRKILGTGTFKKLLEMVPIWGVITNDYLNGKYSSCYKAINSLKADLSLDIYLSKHVHKLYGRFSDNAVIQYFRPFVSVKIPEMAAAFDVKVPEIEAHLASLIADGRIQARIDSHNKVVYARNADQRTATYQQALSVGTKYVRDAKSLLLRMSLVEYDFVVRHPEHSRRKRGDNDMDDGPDAEKTGGGGGP